MSKQTAAEKSERKQRQEDNVKAPAPVFNLVDLRSIIPRKDNRYINTKDPEFLELVESIRGGGIRMALIVKPDKGDKFQLLAGQRRLLAAAEAGLLVVPVLIYDGLDDATAEDIAYIENKYRKDPTPLEEAAEVAKLLDKAHGDAKTVAGRLGKRELWVRMAAHAIKNLSEKWQNAIKKKEIDFNQWTLSHFALIARLPADFQDEIYEELLSIDCLNLTVSELERMIAKELRSLSKMPWDIEDDILVPQAGSCTECMKTSTAQPMLFDDDGMEKTKGLCLDGLCYREKELAYLRKKRDQLNQECPEVFSITEGPVDYYRQQKLKSVFGKVLEPPGYEKSRKDADGAVPAIVVDGANAGKVEYIIPTGKPKNQKAKGEHAGKTPEEKRDRLERKRWSLIIRQIREFVQTRNHEAIVYENKMATILALTVCFGIDTYEHAAFPGTNLEFIENEGRNLGARPDSILLSTAWPAVRSKLVSYLNSGGPVADDELILTARGIAKMLGIETEKLMAEAEKEYPEPASWKNEAKNQIPNPKSETNSNPQNPGYNKKRGRPKGSRNKKCKA